MQERRGRVGMRGFTLIEMMVTFALFGLVMSVLVVGLRTGANSWRSVCRHQAALAQREWALATLSRDVRGMSRVQKDKPPLKEVLRDAGDEMLTLTTLCGRATQRAGIGSVWCEVTYALQEDQENSGQRLVRREQPYVAKTPLADETRETVLLENVHELRFDYLDANGNSVPTWDDNTRLPVAIVVTLAPGDSPIIQRCLFAPCGEAAR